MTGLEIAGLSIAGASVLGQGGNMVATGKLNKKNRDWQEKQTEAANLWTENMWAQEKAYNEEVWGKQKAYNERVWQMQNDYDSPAAQMARFKAAGLNPNLIYGQSSMGGTLDTAQMQTAGSDSVKKADFNPQRLPEMNLVDGIMAYNNFKAQSLQNNNTEAQGELLKKEKAIMDAQLTGLNIKNMQAMFNYDFGSEMRQTSADYKKAQVNNLISQMNQRLLDYDLDVKGMDLKQRQVSQFVKQSNQSINESIARTGATYEGIRYTQERTRNENAKHGNIFLDGLSKEQQIQLGEIQKRFLNQKTDAIEAEMYQKFIQTILSGATRK